MAVILAFAPPARPRAVPVNQPVSIDALRVSSVGKPAKGGAFRWVRDAETGKLVCHYEPAVPDPLPIPMSA